MNLPKNLPQRRLGKRSAGLLREWKKAKLAGAAAFVRKDDEAVRIADSQAKAYADDLCVELLR